MKGSKRGEEGKSGLEKGGEVSEDVWEVMIGLRFYVGDRKIGFLFFCSPSRFYLL